LTAENAEGSGLARKFFHVLFFLFVLYVFFFCIELLGSSFKLFGKGLALELFRVTENPIIGIVIGVLATSLMQSSSSTTSIVVGMVAAGTISVENAIPIVMGANIGTTITNIIVSLGHVQRRKEFELAFSGAVVHDFFNLCAVALFFPLELAFHPIKRTAEFIAGLAIHMEGASFKSPLKTAVKPAVEQVIRLGEAAIDNPKVLGGVLLAVAVGLLLFSLSRMVKIMRGALAERLEIIMDRYLFTGVLRGLLLGLVVTAIVQSSSVTTSLVVPLLGAGIVQIESVFPYMVGANIGTTVTAFLASLVTGNPAAVTIAICHFLFNIFATTVFVPLKVIPISLAKMMGRVAVRNRWAAVAYVIVFFFLLPALLIIIF